MSKQKANRWLFPFWYVVGGRSQVLVKILPHCSSFTLRPWYQIQVTVHHLYFTSDVQVIRFQMVWNWQSAKSVFLLKSTINQEKVRKSMLSRPPSHFAQETVLLISKKGASYVSFWDKLKLRELLRLVPWASEFEHHWAQHLGKAHLPKSMKSPCFPAVFVLHGIDFHVQCHSSKSISSTSWGTLHFTGQQRSCEVAAALRQFHFQTSVSSIIGSSSSLSHFRCSSNYFLLTYIMPNEWCQIDGNQWWTRIVFFPAQLFAQIQ